MQNLTLTHLKVLKENDLELSYLKVFKVEFRVSLALTHLKVMS